MNRSEVINEISKALKEAQKEMKNAQSDSSGNYGDYSTLKAIRQAVQEPFYKHGLSYSQLLGADERGDYLETLLIHDSGQFLSSKLYLKLEKVTMQGMGSAITYARRYSLAAIAGIDQKDDDAEEVESFPGKESTDHKKNTASNPSAKTGEYKIDLGTQKSGKPHWLNGLTLEQAWIRPSPTPGSNSLRDQVDYYHSNSFRNAQIKDFLSHAEPFLKAKQALKLTEPYIDEAPPFEEEDLPPWEKMNK